MSEYEALFDGQTLAGWHAIPRSYGTLYPGGPRLLDVLSDFPADYAEQALAHPAAWTVEDGAIVGRQNPPGSGYGGYLVSDRTFGDFELELDALVDWPADSGIMLRRRPVSWEGIQVLLDYRQSGSIGGFYGNGIGAFHVVPFAVDAQRDADGRPTGLTLDNPETSVEPFSDAKREPLDAACTFEEFNRVWHWDDWNHFAIRCVGRIPTVTVHINDLLVAQLNLATLRHPNYEPTVVSDTLGYEGHIAFEVHDNDPGLGAARWAPTSACRWRDIRIRELPQNNLG